MRVGSVAVLVFAVALALAAAKLRSSAYRKYVVAPTSCMAPTIKSGELIFVRPFRTERDLVERYEIVLFRSPLPVTPAGVWVMRVVGLPGEQVEVRADAVFINGSRLAEQDMPAVLRAKQWLAVQSPELPTKRRLNLGADEVFVVGDNLSAANDSRFWGGLRLSNVIGVVEEKAKGKQLKLTLEPVLPVRTVLTIPDGERTKVN